MNKWMNFLFALPLLVVYFIGIHVPNVNKIDIPHHSVATNDVISAGNTVDIPFHLLSSENSSSWVSSTFKVKQQPFTVSFIAVAVFAEQIYRAEFFQRKHSLQNTIASYRNSLIFFPFHYFW